MAGLHEVDQARCDAYVKSVEADALASQGRLEDARRAMLEASALDRCFSVRAELLGKPDGRRVQVSRTVRRVLVPFLIGVGFQVEGADRWSEGHFLSRIRGAAHGSVLIGRDKFGHQLGLLAARWREPTAVQYFDWKAIGYRSGTLAYRTQSELELVCSRWCALISAHLMPWFEENERAG